MKVKEEKGTKRQKILIGLLAAITAIAVAFAAVLMILEKGEEPFAPDYAPEVEENAEAIPDDRGESADASGGGGKVSLTYSDQVTIDLQKGTASLMFANPGKSNKSVVLQIVIQDTVIAQSGTIMPGKQIAELSLHKGALNKIVSGGYYGKFAVYFYDLDSEEKAVVNTEIPVTITVK